jgi:aspartate dehydrogenase
VRPQEAPRPTPGQAVSRRRVGIIGYGALGRHLAAALLHGPASATHELAFVYNRRPEALADLPEALRLHDLRQAERRQPDLIVEVAHPSITWEHGPTFLRFGDYLVGSPTALARPGVEDALRRAASTHGLYVPRGALPGLEEVLGLVARGQLAQAHITMRKHPASLKLDPEPDPPLHLTTSERVLHDGPLRPLCERAPNNVNTMAVLALASGLGFDRLRATLIADPALQHHITEVDLWGPETGGPRFRLELRRSSPAGAGAVTSSATFGSFLDSLLGARGRGPGLHLC